MDTENLLPLPMRGKVVNREKRKQIDDQQTPMLERAAFEARFRRYKPARRSLGFVNAEQMDEFYTIAEQYRRDALNLPAVGENRQALLDDAKNSKALMAGIRQRLNETQQFITASTPPEPGAAATLAEDAQAQIASVQRRLEEEFEFECCRIEALVKRLSAKSAQHAELEFTLDLLRFVRNSFRRRTAYQRRRLAEAAMAGAGSFTENELKGSTQPRRARMRFSRAKKYQEEMYPEGRVYAYGKMLGKKKQEAAAGEEKG